MPDGVERGGGGGNDDQLHVDTVIKPDAQAEPFAPLKSDESHSGALAALQPQASAVKDPVIGSTVNGYVVKGKLGAGGMGLVYAGEHPVIGKRAAIKVLRPEIAENEEQVKRLVSEARAVNAVGHRGIVDVFGYDTLPDGRQCIVMEYLDGEPLADMLARNKNEKRVMPIPQVLIVLEEILSALGAAHSAGVVHRDLKPSNIFLVKQRDGLSYVKLLDFGIAKQGVLGGSTPQTRASMLVGTPSYMAPEQARGGAVTPAMDLYAVGIIAFEMLTGELPFQGESVVEVLMKHAEEPVPQPSSLLMSIPDDLDEVVVKLLAKKPEERFQTADEVRELVTRCRKTLSESTARSIGLAIGRSMGSSGVHGAIQATPPSQPLSNATPYAGTPTPLELQPPPGSHEKTVIKDGGAVQATPARPDPKRLPPEMVAATQAVPEGAKLKGDAGSSKGTLLGVTGLALGGVALAVAFVTRQPAPPQQPPPAPPPMVKVEAPTPPPAPPPEPVKPPEPAPAVAPPPEAPKPPVQKVEAAKPEPKPAPVAAVARPKVDRLLARFLALEKESAAKPDALPAVDRTILGEYLDALKSGAIKPEQREQAEVFASKVEAELKGQ